MNKKIFIEYDNSKLASISDKLYRIFVDNGYNTTILNNNLSLNNKLSQVEKSNNAFILSNKLNSNNNSIEIIYPLRSNDLLAKKLYDKLNNNYNVTKYYQKRNNINTASDYDEILQNINNDEAIVIRYGENLLNNNVVNIIFETINNYFKEKNIYYVKSGDSLYAIAKRFNTTVDEIKSINNLSSNLLSINQKLIIPDNIESNSNSNSNSNNIYYVKSGDSLYAIAKKFNTTVDEIKRVNNLSSNLLSINQKLIIPSNSTNNIYYVKSGDNLYAIAKKFNTTVDEIKRVNNLSSNLLSINQKLIIP